jgi:hypothetical protein
VLVDPLRGAAVERALGVVALERQDLADPLDQVLDRLTRGPVVADAHRVRRDVGVEHRRQHAEQRRVARVAARHRHFEPVVGRGLDGVALLAQRLHREPDAVALGRVADDPLDVDPRVQARQAAQGLVVGLEPTQSHVVHGHGLSAAGVIGVPSSS